MATIKPAGNWPCIVINGKAGVIKNKPLAQITVQITGGPATGTRCTYEESLIGSGAKYARYSMNAVGWAGVSAKSFEADVEAWIAKTGGESTVEINHLEIKRGEKAGQIWDKVSAIGRGAARKMEDMSADLLADADRALREAAEADGAGRSPASDEESPF